MKLRRKEFEKDGKGSCTLSAEESEDLWHLYNLVAVGDEVKAITYRKVMREDGKSSETKKLRLTIEVKGVEYDADGGAIRFSGTISEENEHVRMGAHHTIEIELHEAITITKDCWDDIFIQQLQDATDISKSAEVSVILMEAKDSGVANLTLMTNVLAKRVGKVEQALPKKRITSTQLDKAMERFFVAMYNAMREKLNLDVVKCVVLGGPGSTKTEFLKWMQAYAMKQGDKDIDKAKSMFVAVDTTSIHNQGLDEILNDPQVASRIANTKAAQHLKAIDECLKRLSNTPEMACYGPAQVKNAFEMGAIDTMMVSDALFRNSSVQVRREYVNLVSEVKASGSTAYVFSSGHVTGQKLKELGDIAANLRFQVEYDEIEEVETETNKVTEKPRVNESQEASKTNTTAAPSSTSTSTNKPKAAVRELQEALGGKVDDARADYAMTFFKGASEDAFLALLAEDLGLKVGPALPKELPDSFAAGDTVEPKEEFASNSKNVVQLPKGKQGKVIKIDGSGDAYIDFGDLGKQWVKGKNFHFLKKCEPPKPAAKAATVAQTKPKPKPKPDPKPKPKKPKGGALQWDDYDY